MAGFVCLPAPHYLRVEDGTPIIDSVPYENADDDAARCEAEAVAQELSSNRLAGSDWKVVVTDDNGRTAVKIPTKWMVIGSEPTN